MSDSDILSPTSISMVESSASCTNSPPANLVEGSRPLSSVPEPDPRGGSFIFCMNGEAPATVKDLTATSIETLEVRWNL